MEVMGRVASTISMLWEAYFSFEGSLGATGSRAASWATSLVVSLAFSVSLAYLASLEEMLATRGALDGLALPSSAFKETGSALEPEMHMARG